MLPSMNTQPRWGHLSVLEGSEFGTPSCLSLGTVRFVDFSSLPQILCGQSWGKCIEEGEHIRGGFLMEDHQRRGVNPNLDPGSLRLEC